ncbi:beta-L-arabinofuranosidase domain-containing protein [Chitinophaga sedimenti]|uniref:beta-L-arabinofuranosidase domain-containing protein n=1 Tax=Chitinophaga sedimenti TaxID=2033606 RepID=UPI00249EEB1D|nr:beta-L-arabinofuranosidase domain-containing protein [Chitinophaga sedimenti]
MMNPFSSRCCQHNHVAGWVYYSEYAWMATPDNGLAAQLYFDNEVKAKVGNGAAVKLSQTTKYPFDENVAITLSTVKPVAFPLYFRVPAWCAAPELTVNGKKVTLPPVAKGYIRVQQTWKTDDKIALRFPMTLSVRTWERNKNSISVNYGPLTYSLLIKENYVQQDSKATAIGDSRWQDGADPAKWPSFEILPASDWNYGLIVNAADPAASFEVVRKSWPADDNPFTNTNAPITLKAKGKKIPSWGIDKYGLTGVLPQSPVKTEEAVTPLVLVPMGGARLRISAFPVVM